MKTLKHLKDYFSTTDNEWVKHKLEILTIEIEQKIIKAKIEQNEKIINTLNK